MSIQKVEVTEMEHLLLSVLRVFPLKESQQLRIFLMMDNEEQMLKMCQYMAKNQSATAEQLMSKAVQITGGLK